MAVHRSEGLPLGTVAHRTGLTPDLIRAWEQRYQVVTPARGPRGTRLYLESDVARQMTLRQLLATGCRIGDVARLSPSAAARPAAETNPPRLAPPASEALMAAVDALDAAALARLLGESLVALGGYRFIDEIAVPLLTAVGERWEQGQVGIGHERLLSGLLNDILAGVRAQHGVRHRAPTLFLATPSGERHGLGLVAAGIVAAGEGLAVYHLGTDLPATEIVRVAGRTRRAAVAISVAYGRNRRRAAAEVQHLTAALPPTVDLWLGGREASAVARLVRSSRPLVLSTPSDIQHAAHRLHDPRMRA